jgi:hypothetical protein
MCESDIWLTNCTIPRPEFHDFNELQRPVSWIAIFALTEFLCYEWLTTYLCRSSVQPQNRLPWISFSSCPEALDEENWSLLLSLFSCKKPFSLSFPMQEQRDSRSIAVLILTWVLVVDSCSRPRPGLLATGKRPGTCCRRGRVDPRAGLGKRKYLALPGFEPRTLQTVASCHTDCAFRAL